MVLETDPWLTETRCVAAQAALHSAQVRQGPSQIATFKVAWLRLAGVGASELQTCSVAAVTSMLAGLHPARQVPCLDAEAAMRPHSQQSSSRDSNHRQQGAAPPPASRHQAEGLGPRQESARC